MPTVSVRISDDEVKRLRAFGSLSKSIRAALELYLDRKESEELLKRLDRLQRENTIKTSSAEELRLIREDRTR